MLRLYIVELLRLYRRRLFPALLYLYSLINENSGKKADSNHICHHIRVNTQECHYQ